MTQAVKLRRHAFGQWQDVALVDRETDRDRYTSKTDSKIQGDS